jgi:hypothetical protein
VNVCGSQAWQAFGTQSSRDRVGLRGGSLGKCSPDRAEEWAQGSEIPWPVEQRLCRPIRCGLACNMGCSFSKSCCGDAFHELGVQSADVSALPCVLPQPSVSPVSQESPCFMELMRSAAVFQSLSWIFSDFTLDSI